MNRNAIMTAGGRFEPSLTTVFLPGCRADRNGAPCGHPHPLAMKPVPADTAHCPACGAAVADPGDPVKTEAVVTGQVKEPLLARLAFGAARILRNMAGKV